MKTKLDCRVMAKCHMIVVRAVAVAVGVVCAAGVLRAQQENIFDRVPQLVAEHSPRVAQLRMETVADVARMRLDNRLDNPEVAGSYLWGPTPVPDRWEVEVSQQLGNPATYRARRHEIERRRRQGDAAVALAVSEETARVRSLLVDMVYNRLSRDLATKLVQSLETISEVTSTAYSHGEVTVLDVNRATIELAKARVELERLEQENLEISGKLLQASIIVPDDELSTISYPSWTLEWASYFIKDYCDNPLVNDIEARRELARATAKVYRTEAFPQFKLGYVHAREDGNHFNGLQVGMTLPLWGSHGRRKANALALDALENDWDQLLLNSIFELYAAVERARRLDAQLAALRPVFNVTDNVALLHKAWKGGQLSLTDYLRDALYFVAAEQDFMSLEHAYYLEMVKLQQYSPTPSVQ